MSRRKQLKPRHLETEDDETWSQSARDQDEADYQRVGPIKKRSLKFEDFDASVRDDTCKRKFESGKILRVMKENIPLDVLDDIARCPSVDLIQSTADLVSKYDNEEAALAVDSSRNEFDLRMEEAEEVRPETDEPEPENEFDDQTSRHHSSSFLFTPAPHPLLGGGLSYAGDARVKLTSIRSTDVAVAQFAENNILPSELAVLNLVLLNLQQQQLFQMHLLQQLQQQLMYATNGTISPRNLMPNFTSPESKSPSKSVSADVTPASTEAIFQHVSQLSAATPSASDNRVPFSPNPHFGDTDSTEQQQTTTNTSDQRPADDEASLPPILAMIGMSTRKLPFLPDKLQEKENAMDVVGGSGLSSGSKSHSFSHPLRNRCRFCQKIFNSDSALQIHIRSHTGERPFKCSVCGNRFSTKGNLKVHFRCHTDTYPSLNLDQKPVVSPHILNQMTAQAFPVSSASGPPQPLSTSSDVEPRNFTAVDQNKTSLETALPPKEQSPSTSQALKLFDPPSMWQKTAEDDAAGLSIVTESSPFPLGEPKISSDPLLPLPGAASSIIHSFSTAMNSETETQNKKSNLLISPPPAVPLIPHPPPPLSLLSSMSSSFPAFPSPLFSSFSSPHQPALAAAAPVSLRPFAFDAASPSRFFRSSSLHNKKDDPLEQFMEVNKSSETTKMEKLVQNIEKKLSDPNQCGICFRTLSCKSALQMHYRTHTGERPFRCKICGRAFTTKGNLKTHMGVHRAKPPVRMLHQCPVCHKQFTNALVLQQHIRMHTGDLPKQLPFHPGGMMLVPHAMGYLHPFPGYPFFPPAFNPGQQHSVLLPSLEDVKRRSQYGNTFDQMEKTKLEDNGRKEDSEMEDDLSKTEESSSSSSSSSSIFPSKEKFKSSEKPSEMQTIELSQQSSVEDIDVDSPIYDSRKLPSISDNNEDDDEEKDAQINDPHRDQHAHSYQSNEDSVNVKDMQEDGFHERDRNEILSPTPADGNYEEDDRNALVMGGEYLEYDDFPQSKYSASLMALEEKVNEINVQGASNMTHPLQQMEKIVRRTEDLISVSRNHLRPGEENQEPSATVALEGRKLTSPSSSYKVKSSYSPLGNGEGASQSRADFSFILNSSADKARRHFGSVALSPKSFEATTGKPNTTCGVCYKTFACKSALDIHYRSHTKERPFRCRVCDRAFSTKGNMKQHMMTHKGSSDNGSQMQFSSEGSSSSNPRSCATPEDSPGLEKFEASLQSMPRTPVEISVENPSAECKEILLNSEELGRSGAIASPRVSKQPRFDDHSRCPVAMSPSPATSRRSALRHLCSVCEKPFSSASALQIHMRTHTGDRPFTCTVCGKAFTTKGNLKVHMGTHMWNNGPSRRGRKMSVEGGVGGMAAAPKTPEFFGAPSRIPALHELYHFPFHGFPGRFSSPKLNEISVIQKMNGAIQNFLPESATPDMMNRHMPSILKPLAFPLHAPSLAPLLPLAHPLETPIKCRNDGSTGGIKKSWTGETSSPQVGNNGELDLSVKRSPVSPSTSTLSPSWMWKTTCSICSKVFFSQGALELHTKTHSDFSHKTDSPKSVLA